MADLTSEQQAICDAYLYSNYARNLPVGGLTDEEIARVERATRGQSDNPLWSVLRLDRRTASGSLSASGANTFCTQAMSFGLHEEKLVKSNKNLIDLIKQKLESRLNAKIVESVLDCGMFFSRLGLSAASPDAYFRFDTGALVPVEIKCPMSYRNVSVDEMRNGLNTRKPRYRVKHTAFSVNRSGPALFSVESTDPHYRQMQRQMYVLEAPLCVYLVKFKDSFVAKFVDRDERFCAQERINEQQLFNALLAQTQNRTFVTEKARVASFENQNHTFSAKQVLTLATNGLYYSFGRLLCNSCASNFDCDMKCDDVLTKHASCQNRRCVVEPSLSLEAQYVEYVDHAERVKSLLAARLDPQRAEQGVFHCAASDELKTFCCGNSVSLNNDNGNVKHTDKCVYAHLFN
ncbi:alkaline exonuclease [Orgyia pseudotsugata single capsid nuclopolyhedrovirus]|nr:alkaline exonuclease [Orgyia pseudotsugata single capsid nuclopolyhedrovirus]